MKNVVITFNNGKTVHYLNSKYYKESNLIVIEEYDDEENIIGSHYYNEFQIKEIKYEG